MDNIESLPDKPLDYKYLLIGRYDSDSHNIHMGAGRTKREIVKIAKSHKNWVEKTIYVKDSELTKKIK